MRLIGHDRTMKNGSEEKMEVGTVRRGKTKNVKKMMRNNLCFFLGIVCRS